jgi:hypothetical protein
LTDQEIAIINKKTLWSDAGVTFGLHVSCGRSWLSIDVGDPPPGSGAITSLVTARVDSQPV